VRAGEPWARRRRADEHDDYAATPAVPLHRFGVPGTVRWRRSLLGSGVERLVRVPDDAQRADAPTCDGFCTDPSKACVFNQSGSSCVRIP